MKISILSILAIGVMLSCSPTSSEQKTAENTPAITTKQPTEALDNYLTLKDALVKSDAVASKTAATELSTSLTSEKMDSQMIEAANLIASSDDLNAQRVAFKTITDGIISALKANETAEGIFVQYCPMAFNNTGANWLSMSEEIRNPYFGDRMLKCGRVIEEL